MGRKKNAPPKISVRFIIAPVKVFNENFGAVAEDLNPGLSVAGVHVLKVNSGA